MILRDETEEDVATVRAILIRAFAHHPHSDQREYLIVDALRASGALSVSLVAEVDDEVVGAIAFSRVLVDGQWQGWYGLGPVAVEPAQQGKGIGQALVRAGLARLVAMGAAGCVLLGEPDYYQRFGFETHSDLRLEGVPAEYFLSLPLRGQLLSGLVAYDPAFFET